MTTDIDFILNKKKGYETYESEYIWDIIKAANESEIWELVSVVKETDEYVGIFKRRVYDTI